MITFRAGSPILVGDHLAARMDRTITVEHETFRWTWHARIDEPPRWNGKAPENQGELAVAFERGPFQILEARLQGRDLEWALRGGPFAPPDTPLTAPPENLLQAADLLLSAGLDPRTQDELHSLRAFLARKASASLRRTPPAPLGKGAGDPSPSRDGGNPTDRNGDAR